MKGIRLIPTAERDHLSARTNIYCEVHLGLNQGQLLQSVHKHIEAVCIHKSMVNYQVNAFIRAQQQQQRQQGPQSAQQRQRAADLAGRSYAVHGEVEAHSSLPSPAQPTPEPTLVFRAHASRKLVPAPESLLYEVQYLQHNNVKDQARALLGGSTRNSPSGSPSRAPAPATPNAPRSGRPATAVIKLRLLADGSGWVAEVTKIMQLQPQS